MQSKICNQRMATTMQEVRPVSTPERTGDHDFDGNDRPVAIHAWEP
ncbi:MAG: hypothetical protein H6752_00635 [Candidatus Omnitrophica bacterium]|nr:hypothetical protein [Candidatus Omnitrophota bacterium]